MEDEAPDTVRQANLRRRAEAKVPSFNPVVLAQQELADRPIRSQNGLMLEGKVALDGVLSDLQKGIASLQPAIQRLALILEYTANRETYTGDCVEEDDWLRAQGLLGKLTQIPQKTT